MNLRSSLILFLTIVSIKTFGQDVKGIVPIFGFEEGAAVITTNNWEQVTKIAYHSIEGMFTLPVDAGKTREYYLGIRYADNITDCSNGQSHLGGALRFYFSFHNTPGHNINLARIWGGASDGQISWYQIPATIYQLNQAGKTTTGSNGRWRIDARIPQGCPDKELRIFGIWIMAVDKDNATTPTINWADNLPVNSGNMYAFGGRGGNLYYSNSYLGIKTNSPKADIVVGNNFGAAISGSSGGKGVFGSNLAVYGFAAGANSNKLYTPYTHTGGYGYSGVSAEWGRLLFYTASGNTVEGEVVTPSPSMVIRNNGNVGIGTSIPDAKLTVKGAIHAEEVKVDLSVPGPDYVFESDYPLMSLADLEAYLKLNKHMPEVPSAKEMEANGVNLLEMNMLLLKKVEELTLYILQENKEKTALDIKLEEALKRIEQLEKKSNK